MGLLQNQLTQDSAQWRVLGNMVVASLSPLEANILSTYSSAIAPLSWLMNTLKH
jgi:hypothetical protein